MAQDLQGPLGTIGIWYRIIIIIGLSAAGLCIRIRIIGFRVQAAKVKSREITVLNVYHIHRTTTTEKSQETRYNSNCQYMLRRMKIVNILIFRGGSYTRLAEVD